MSALTSSADVFTANAPTCDTDTQQDKQRRGEMDWWRGSCVSHWVDSDGWQTGSDKVPQDCVMLHHIMLSQVILSHFAVARTGCGFCTL